MNYEPTRRTFPPAGPEGRTGTPAGLTVPSSVGPYFTTSQHDPATLGGYAAATGREVTRPESAAWTRLGHDSGFQLCADPTSAVWAVLLDFDETDRFVSSSAALFADSLDDLQETLRTILGTDRPDVAASAFATLEQRLRERDPAAFGSRENWWPLVLDDIRDTASVANYAAFEIVDAQGEKRIVTQSGAVAAHPEERLWAALHAGGVEPEQVLRVHTDLEPCFMPGHYCSMWLAEVLPHAESTHSFPYGETAASRAEGVRLLRERAGSQAPDA